jgi:hypothetical protein
MVTELLAAGLARRFQVPIVIVAAVAGVIAAGNLITPLICDPVATYAAFATGGLAAIIFLCATFDPRFQNATWAFNSRKPARPRVIQWGVILFGRGLPPGDRALLVANWLLLIETLAAANFVHRASAAALSGTAFALVAMTRIALVVQGYLRDHPPVPLSH